MKRSLITAIDIVFGVKYLGPGLASDVFLLNVTAIYAGLILAVPKEMFTSSILWDIAWEGWGRWLAVPFILKTLLTGIGVVMVIMEKKYSRYFRFSGAVVGLVIWYWLIAKYIFVGEILNLPFPIVSAIFSLRILAISWANLPRQVPL